MNTNETRNTLEDDTIFDEIKTFATVIFMTALNLAIFAAVVGFIYQVIN